MNKLNVGCIGSREVNDEQLRQLMVQTGAWLALNGHGVWSGNAEGADQAYAGGANQIDPKAVTLCLPWITYEKQAIVVGNTLLVDSTDYEKQLAVDNHPAWPKLNQAVQKLMYRNATIVNRSNCTIAYLNPKKIGGGGTGHGVRISRSLGHGVLLLTADSNFKQVEIFIGDEMKKQSQ